MRITDLKCAVIGDNPIVRVVTDAGISGYASVESFKPYLKPHIMYYAPYIIGEDPTLVERMMLNIRHRGAFKPWGSAVERHRDGVVGHRRQSRRTARPSPAGRQSARPRARVQRRRALPDGRLFPRRLRREHGAHEKLAREVHADQARHRLPQPDAAPQYRTSSTASPTWTRGTAIASAACSPNAD